MHSIRIVLLCIFAAILYGIVHDQVSARVCIEYFTIGHAPIFLTNNPTLLGLGWGAIATWWVGLLLGIPLAIVARAGSRPKRSVKSLIRPIGYLLSTMAIAALASGIVGWLLARAGAITLMGRAARRVSPDRHPVFLADLWAHSASYLVGLVGGVVVLVLVWRSRGEIEAVDELEEMSHEESKRETKSLKQLLAESDDFALCDAIHTKVVEWHGDDFDVSAISEEERTVLLVWHVSGIIGNGGFRYLFEGNLTGDPYFALTAKAFQATGCTKAADAVEKTLAMFPNSRPPTDIDARLTHYLRKIKAWPSEQDEQFYDTQEELTKSLARYIRSHEDVFARLEMQPPKKPQRKKSRQAKTKRPKKSGPELADLPHWARVAFVAHSARQVYPLLTKFWPGISAKRSRAVRAAIDLAEQSAAEGQPVEGIEEAIIETMAAAGAALMCGSKLGGDKVPPENAELGTLASFVAKVAEKAAEAATTEGESSLFAAEQAWSFANNVATSANQEHIVEKLKEKMAKLHRAATRGKWIDQSKVPVDIWSVL